MADTKAAAKTDHKGFYIQLGLLAGAEVLGLITAPGVKRSLFEEVSDNRGDESDLWPYIAGKRRTTPHMIWYGDFNSRKVKGDINLLSLIGQTAISAASGFVSGGPIGAAAAAAITAGTTIAGAQRAENYRYYMGFVYGICHGRINMVRQVFKDKRSVAVIPTLDNAGGTILIDDPQAWGGDHAQGGEYALCDIVAGDWWPTQHANTYWRTQINDVPAYSGKSLFVIRGPSGFRESGYFAAGAPNVRQLELEVVRCPDTIGGVEAFSRINTFDANPVECIFEWNTARGFGARRPRSLFDIATYQACAETIYNEGLGISIEINTNQDSESVIDDLCSYISAIQYGSFRTGNVKLKLIRRDYSIPSLPVFRHGADGSDPTLYNVLSLSEFSPGAWAETINEVRVEFIDDTMNFQSRPVIAQDQANRDIRGGKIVTKTSGIVGATTSDNAAFIATRELRAGSYPRPPITAEVNRDGTDLEYGSVIKLISEPYGFSKIMRVTSFAPGIEGENRIKLGLVEDMFAVGESAFGGALPSSWSNPVSGAAAIATAIVQDAPYFLTSGDEPRLMFLAKRPNSSQQDYNIYISDDGGATYTLLLSKVDFTPTATLNVEVLRLSDVELTDIIVTPEDSLLVTLLESFTAADLAAGKNLFQWGSEVGSFEEVTDNGDGTYTLGVVWRATLDSTPQPHAAGERLYFFYYGFGLSPLTYPTGTSLKFKLLANTINGSYPEASATAINFTTTGRAFNPNPVGNVLINSGYLTLLIGVSDDIQIDWNERNRTTQIAVIKQDEASVTPEASTEYEVRFYATEDGGNDLLTTESGITATTATLTAAEEIASPNYLGHLSTEYRIEIDVIRDGEVSNTYIREVRRPVPVPTITLEFTAQAPAVSVTVPVAEIEFSTDAPTLILQVNAPVTTIEFSAIAPDASLANDNNGFAYWLDGEPLEDVEEDAGFGYWFDGEPF